MVDWGSVHMVLYVLLKGVNVGGRQSYVDKLDFLHIASGTILADLEIYKSSADKRHFLIDRVSQPSIFPSPILPTQTCTRYIIRALQPAPAQAHHLRSSGGLNPRNPVLILRFFLNTMPFVPLTSISSGTGVAEPDLARLSCRLCREDERYLGLTSSGDSCESCVVATGCRAEGSLGREADAGNRVAGL